MGWQQDANQNHLELANCNKFTEQFFPVWPSCAGEKANFQDHKQALEVLRRGQQLVEDEDHLYIHLTSTIISEYNLEKVSTHYISLYFIRVLSKPDCSAPKRPV